MQYSKEMKELDDHLTDLHGAQLERAWIGTTRLSTYASSFLEKGYAVIELSDTQSTELRGFFDPELKIQFSVGDCSDQFWGGGSIGAQHRRAA